MTVSGSTDIVAKKEEDQKLQRARNAVDDVVIHPLENLPRQVIGFHDNSPGL